MAMMVLIDIGRIALMKVALKTYKNDYVHDRSKMDGIDVLAYFFVGGVLSAVMIYLARLMWRGIVFILRER